MCSIHTNAMVMNAPITTMYHRTPGMAAVLTIAATWHGRWYDHSDAGERLTRHRCERLSPPPSVSSVAPQTRVQASTWRISKSNRNRPGRMLAAGANSQVLARPDAARQPDRRSAEGIALEPAQERNALRG